MAESSFFAKKDIRFFLIMMLSSAAGIRLGVSIARTLAPQYGVMAALPWFSWASVLSGCVIGFATAMWIKARRRLPS